MNQSEVNDRYSFGKEPNDISRNLGKLLKRERRKRSISQCSLSDLANVNNSYYCSIEQGTVNMSVVKLLNICESLDVDPSKIMQDLSALNRKSYMKDDKNGSIAQK
jgi:transcriptional regulator with XRE-family HTH domain